MSWTAVAGSAVAGGSSIIGQALANDANRELQKDQQGWNESMWHQQNSYNTPEAQMQRYRDAGLNPNLVLGEGNVGSGSASSPAAPATQPRMENVMGNLDPVGDYMRIKNASAGIENIQADTDNKRKDIELKDLDLILKGMDTKTKQWFLKAYIADYGDRRSQTKIQTRVAQLELITKQINVDLSKQDLIGKQLTNQKQQIQNAYEEIRNILEIANSYRNLKGTILQNKISKEEFNYMNNNKFKMGTTSALVGILTDLITGGQGTQQAKQNLKIQVERLLQGKDRNINEMSPWEEGGQQEMFKHFGLEPPVDDN